jgi:cobalt/nickel transport protein
MLRRYWLILVIMALLTPLGLLAEGTAWGEWGAEDLAATLGFVPRGIDQATAWWQALLPDYSVRGMGEKTGYVVSALAGSALVYLAAMAYMKAIARSK